MPVGLRGSDRWAADEAGSSELGGACTDRSVDGEAEDEAAALLGPDPGTVTGCGQLQPSHSSGTAARGEGVSIPRRERGDDPSLGDDEHAFVDGIQPLAAYDRQRGADERRLVLDTAQLVDFAVTVVVEAITDLLERALGGRRGLPGLGAARGLQRVFERALDLALAAARHTRRANLEGLVVLAVAVVISLIARLGGEGVHVRPSFVAVPEHKAVRVADLATAARDEAVPIEVELT